MKNLEKYKYLILIIFIFSFYWFLSYKVENQEIIIQPPIINDNIDTNKDIGYRELATTIKSFKDLYGYEIGMPNFYSDENSNILTKKELEASSKLRDLIEKDFKEDMAGTNFCNNMKDFKSEDFKFFSDAIDINSDGSDEFIITLTHACNEFLRGAQGNGDISVFQKIENDWINIGNIWGVNSLVLVDKTNGYNDIVAYSHMSATSGIINIFRWDKSKYVLYESIDVGY